MTNQIIPLILLYLFSIPTVPRTIHKQLLTFIFQIFVKFQFFSPQGQAQDDIKRPPEENDQSTAPLAD